MKKSSLLTFLCFTSNDGSEQIVAFCLLRELAELPPSEVYWYQKGKVLLSNAEDGRHYHSWSCIGSVEKIDEIRLNLLNQLIIRDFKKKEVRVRFASGDLRRVEMKDGHDIYIVPGSRPLSTELMREFYTLQAWNTVIGPCITPILDEKISEAIVGYKQNLKSHPNSIDPPGLLGQGYLHKYLQHGIVFVREPLGIDLDFSGEPVGRGNIPVTGFRGCASNLPQEFNPLKLQILDEFNELVGETAISSNQGWAEWRIECIKKGVSKGSVRISNSEGEILGWEKFYLLTQIDMNVNIQHAIVKDLYGREISIGERKDQIPAPSKIVWQPSFRENPVDLSDKIADVIASLAPIVLVNDPYGFGNLKTVDGKENAPKTVSVNSGTQCFLNALIVAMTKVKITEIRILCDPVRLGKNSEAIRDQIELYRMLFGDLKKLQIENVTIGLSKSRFHDRYYLGVVSEQNGHNFLFKSTKSVSGLLSTDDLEIEESRDNRAVVAKITDRWNAADRRAILG